MQFSSESGIMEVSLYAMPRGSVSFFLQIVYTLMLRLDGHAQEPTMQLYQEQFKDVVGFQLR